MTYQNYNFTAFREADLLKDGDWNINHGDTFVMPGDATVNVTVRDNDSRLSGDNWNGESRDISNDQHGQNAFIDGEATGGHRKMFIEKAWYVKGSDGKTYTMAEVEIGGHNADGAGDDYFTFVGDVPPAGVSLTVFGCCNVTGHGIKYEHLGATPPEPVAPPQWDLDPDTCTYTVEAESLDLHGFHAVEGDNASGGALAKISGHDGKISTDFGGEDGVYNLTICVQDECDGNSKLMVYVNGEFQQTVKLDSGVDGWGSDNGGFSEVTLEGLEIAEGDDVEIRAWRDGGEYVRIDALKFEQVKFEECDEPGAVKLDFEGFAAGDILGAQIDGLTISAMGGSGDAMIFDSQNPTGGDGDLETQVAQLGNVLIVSEDGDKDDPDDAIGGKLTFEFENPSLVFDLKVVDTEEGGTITLTLEDGSTKSFDIPNLVNGGVGQVVMDVADVVRMDVQLDGSGAIDDLCYVPGEGQAPLGSLSGRYFCDENRDGLDNDGSANGVVGVLVELLDANGNGTGTTTRTDADGNYSFTALTPGTYGVKFTDEVSGKQLTTQNVDQNASDAIDSDAGDIGGGMSVINGIVVVADQDTPDNDAGVVEIPGALSGTYFCDDDRDGVDDGAANGDADVVGRTVMLFEADGVTPATDIDGNPIASALTDANGNYRFDNLGARDYVVKFEATDGKEFIAQDAGNDDTIDSDADPDTGITAPVTVVAGQETENVDVGVQELLGSLSGRYFCDDDEDGLDNDGSDNGIAGVEVALKDANGNPVLDGNGNPRTTTTDAQGNYAFTGLVAATYMVMFADAVSGKELTTQDVDGDMSDDIDSDASDLGGGMSLIEGIVVVAGQNTPDNDAGVIVPNVDPVATEDAGMGCADEEIVVDLSDNFSDADSASVSITMLGGLNIADGETILLDGTASLGGGGTFDFVDVSVTRNGDAFTFDGEEAFSSLGFGASATASFEFKVEDSDGATATANVDVTFKGYASEETIGALIDGTTVNYTVLQGATLGEFVDAYTLEITGSSNAALPTGSYTMAYCMDAIQTLEAFVPSTGNVFLATEANAAAVGSAGLNADNIDSVNWLLNNDQTQFDNGDGNSKTYTDFEVQEAIWTLMNGDTFVINEFPFQEVTDNNNGVRDGLEIGTVENINEIVQIALAQGDGFVAQDGDIFGLIIDPTSPDGQEQPFIFGVEYECIC